MKSLVTIFILSLHISFAQATEITFSQNTKFQFATVNQARQILTDRDDFITSLSPFDRAARLKSAVAISEPQFIAFIATNILAFEPAEIGFIQRSLEKLKPSIDALKLNWPPSILFIKTTGAEEGNAAYTRAHAIIFPRSKLTSTSDEPIDGLLAHELFHVLSRHNPALKEKLYNAIGFHKCDELKFPSKLQRITNPDAPKNDHWISLKTNGKTITAVPILYAEPPSYDLKKGGESFQYLQFKFLVVQTNGPAINYDTENPTLLNPPQVQGFFEQIGQNTQYIIHPEEILAENFKLLVTNKKPVRTPEILEKIRAALTDQKK